MDNQTPLGRMTDFQLNLEYKSVMRKDCNKNKYHAYFQKHKAQVIAEVERRLSNKTDGDD